jgi:uncharacterized protein YfbU (UPF0304 family)
MGISREANMQLRDADRVILVLLAEVLEKLGGSDQIDPDFVKDCVYSDHPWALRWKYHGLFGDRHEPNPKEVDETADILTMWRVVEDSFAKLPPDQKERVAKEADPWSLEFDGFDGNDEGEHYSAADMIIKKLGRFEEYQPRELNAHSARLGHYRQMLRLYREGGQRHPLAADEIVRIVRAGR